MNIAMNNITMEHIFQHLQNTYNFIDVNKTYEITDEITNNIIDTFNISKEYLYNLLNSSNKFCHYYYTKSRVNNIYTTKYYLKIIDLTIDDNIDYSLINSIINQEDMTSINLENIEYLRILIDENIELKNKKLQLISNSSFQDYKNIKADMTTFFKESDSEYSAIDKEFLIEERCNELILNNKSAIKELKCDIIRGFDFLFQMYRILNKHNLMNDQIEIEFDKIFHRADDVLCGFFDLTDIDPNKAIIKEHIDKLIIDYIILNYHVENNDFELTATITAEIIKHFKITKDKLIKVLNSSILCKHYYKYESRKRKWFIKLINSDFLIDLKIRSKIELSVRNDLTNILYTYYSNILLKYDICWIKCNTSVKKQSSTDLLFASRTSKLKEIIKLNRKLIQLVNENNIEINKTNMIIRY